MPSLLAQLDIYTQHDDIEITLILGREGHNVCIKRAHFGYKILHVSNAAYSDVDTAADAAIEMLKAVREKVEQEMVSPSREAIHLFLRLTSAKKLKGKSLTDPVLEELRSRLKKKRCAFTVNCD